MKGSNSSRTFLGMPIWKWLPLGLMLGALIFIVASCSQAPDATDDGLGGPNGGGGTDTCAVPNLGCECNEPGRVVDCGRVESRSGDYVSCSMGKRVCDGAHWGDCIGDGISTARFAGGLHYAGFGASTLCADNPCDPYCNNYVDDVDGGIGAEGGAGFIADGGLGLGSYTGPAALQTSSNGLSTCGSAANLTTPGQPCTPGVPGTCKQDFRCDTTGASPQCVWNGGEGYYDRSVAGADLTIGTACDIGFGSYIPVCNRGSGTVPADAEIRVYLTPRTTIPNGCAAAPSATPDCKTKVPTGGLVAGSCLNLACKVPGDMNAVVNPGSPGNITESSGMCANNVAYVNVTGGSCASCISCNTYIEGTVHDPGLNVGLQGITVFEPYTSPSVISDNNPATGPVCDSCTSLLDPTSFSTGVNTQNDGSFSMGRVTPGPNRWIVAQTGRWRRKLKLDIPACVTTTLTDDQIRMPRNRSEGDIPKMALVSGDQEALDCWLLKVGLDAAEVWPRGGIAPGDTVPDQARIQLYYTNGMTQAISCPAASKTLGAACGSCNSGMSCNAGANNTCLACGGSGQQCCSFGSPCVTAGTVCDDTNTCTLCGTANAPCCETGTACTAAGTVCDPGSNTCKACGTNGKAPCVTGTACAAGTALDPATNLCVTCGASGQACCRTGTACGSSLLCDDTTDKCAACGTAGAKCCPGSTCTATTRACEPASNLCQTCGTSAGQPCCAGNTCSGSGLTCSAAGVCLKNSAGSGQDTPVGACGASGQPCCKVNPSTQTTLCVTGLTCSSTTNGTCSKCGGQGQACCSTGAACTSPMTCGTDGKCGCGGNGETCCAGNTCRGTGLTCTGGKCSSCGDIGESCCAGNTCTAAGATCGGGGVAGICGNCGGIGQLCCGGTTCTAGLSCGAGGAGKCGECGGHGEACCAGNVCNTPGDSCNSGTCSQLCGGLGQAACAGDTCATDGLKSVGGTCQCYSRIAAPLAPVLWAPDPGTGVPPINEYSAVMLPCSGLDDVRQLPINYPASAGSDFRQITTAEQTVMLNWANKGGRVFVDHLPGSAGWLHRAGSISAWNGSNLSTWTSGSSAPTAPGQGFILNNPGPRATMNAWLSLWAPYTPGPGAGWLRVGTPRSDAIDIGVNGTEWIRGKSNNSWGTNPPVGGNYDLSFSFETPVGAANTCGRVIYNDMHVAPSRASNNKGLFPTQCSSAALTDEELALEYQFFQLTACQLGGSPPPPPPPPPPPAPALEAATFVRDYHAICPAGSKIVWQFLSWQASVPTGTNIVFSAQTAPSQAGLDAAPSVGAGKAVITTTPAGTWFHDANTVDWHLANDIPGNKMKSQEWLRVSMLFNPTGAVTPILYTWRQAYDCIPNE